MVGRYKVLKRFIKTVIDQLPYYINEYSSEDQVHLNKFLRVLRGYQVDTQTAREALYIQLREFSSHYRPTEEYLQLPFLWFAVSYFENANRLLSVANFHGDQFYKYFVENLRKSSEEKGAFQLIREKIPLIDLEWERLQYACNKLRVPLTSDQLQILETIISNLEEGGLSTINRRHLKTSIENKVRRFGSTGELNRFFTLIDARWSLWYYLPAFGLELVYFHFQLSKSTSLQA